MVTLGKGTAGPSFLLICDEWLPKRGGISRFNRLAALALAAAGYVTYCLVESATQLEQDDAQAQGIRLLIADQVPPSEPNLYAPIEAIVENTPDIIIGHDRISGSIAWMYARKYSRACLVLIIHIAPAEIEPLKQQEESSVRVKSQEDLMRAVGIDADIIAAVGPQLARYTRGLFVSTRTSPTEVLQLDPGLEILEDTGPDVREIRSQASVLVLGRATYTWLKGLDIAARAVAELKVARDGQSPCLCIRGVRTRTADELGHQLAELSGLSRERIEVRPFTSDFKEVVRDLMRASVCIMPSRSDGFGLSAIEAISLGTPALVSERSGAAEMLRKRLGSLAEPMIISIADEPSVDIPRWSSAIQRILDDMPAALDYAVRIREALAKELCWNYMVETLLSGLMHRADRLGVALEARRSDWRRGLSG